MINRITDDGCELNVQLNAMMYDHDKNIPDSIRYGLAGFIGQLNKCRGAEASAQYLIEGAWNPQINPQSFYKSYLGRLYGPDALDTMLKAYMLLEENEKTLGWHGRSYLLSTFVHGNRMALKLRKVDYKAEELKLDRTEVEKDIKTAEKDVKFWDDRAAQCRQALDLMRQARSKVLPGSRDELDYMIYKTENFITVFELLSAADATKATFDRALLAMNAGETDRVDKLLDQSQAGMDRANRLVRESAEQMIPYTHIPTEKHILYLFNDAMPSHKESRNYLAEAIAFWKEKKL